LVPFCTRCGRDNVVDAHFCAGCGTPLATAARREERKVVTVVFADLVGSTARAEGQDPEDVRAFLAQYHERARHELERYGGTVEKFIGDAVVAVFGAPVAHDDDPERAVRAAFAVVDAVAELNEDDPELGLGVRVGVSTGETLVSLGVRPETGEVMVSGDVTNTCARLQAASPVGGVLVGEQTFHATDRVIEYRELGAVDAKGRREPLAAWLAVAPRARFGVDLSGPGRAPLVGRADELDGLRRALQRVRTARAPHLATLVGVPGIGKSRLVHELLRIVDDDDELILWRQGRSLPYGGGVTYWALGEMVKAQAGILESDSAEEAEAKLQRETEALLEEGAERAWVERHLRPLVGLSAGEGEEIAGESMAAWRRFFEALAERNVTILVFDDLHWADDGLLDFVEQLVPEVGPVPLLVVCTARPDLLERRPGWGGGLRNAHTVSLTPLSGQETETLLASLFDGNELASETLAALVESAGGVPLFAEEYARMVESGGAGSGIPATLHGILGARLDGLQVDEKRLVHAASVLGKVFWTDALAVLGGEDDLDPLLRALERKEFVRRERRSAVAGASQYAFVHSLLRDAAYAQIPRAERARLHRRAADWIDTLEPGRANDRAEMLAHHLLSATELGRAAGIDVADVRARAVDALRRAGDRTWGLAAPRAAARLYGRALEVIGEEEPDPVLRFNLGRALILSGERERGLDQLERARRGLLERDDRETAAAALVLQHEARWVNGEEVGTTLLDEASALVADIPDSIPRVRVIGTVARFMALSGRSGEALRLAGNALQTVRWLGDRELEGWLLNTRGLSRLNLGDVDGLEDLESARSIAEEIGSSDHVRSHVNLGGVSFQLGNLELAHHHHRVALDLTRRRGFRPYARWLAIELAQDAYVGGDWAEAERLVASRLEGADGDASYMDVQARFLALEITAARAGEVDPAALESLIADAHRIGDPQTVLPILAGAARIATTVGWTDRVDPLLDAFVEHAEPPGNLSAWETYGAIGSADPERAARLLELAERGAPSRWSDASRFTARGNHVAAADVLADMGARTDEAAARLRAATALAAGGEVAHAAVQAAFAAAFYDEVGAVFLAERARGLTAAAVA
jgi:class 3 adenylate cyclase/tetratricopeptide (TPR) repeat protein